MEGSIAQQRYPFGPEKTGNLVTVSGNDLHLLKYNSHVLSGTYVAIGTPTIIITIKFVSGHKKLELRLYI